METFQFAVQFLEVVAGWHQQVLVRGCIVDHLHFTEQSVSQLGGNFLCPEVLDEEIAQPVVPKVHNRSAVPPRVNVPRKGTEYKLDLALTCKGFSAWDCGLTLLKSQVKGVNLLERAWDVRPQSRQGCKRWGKLRRGEFGKRARELRLVGYLTPTLPTADAPQGNIDRQTVQQLLIERREQYALQDAMKLIQDPGNGKLLTVGTPFTLELVVVTLFERSKSPPHKSRGAPIFARGSGVNHFV